MNDTPQLSEASSSQASSPVEPTSDFDASAMSMDPPSSSAAQLKEPQQQNDSAAPQSGSSSPAATLIVKRKASNEAKSSAPAAKKAKTGQTPQLVELKNGKLVYKSRSLGLENQMAALKQRMTLQESLQDGKEPLDAFPEQHYAALAKIIHESEKTLPELAKHARTLLVPSFSSTASVTEEGDASKPVDLLPVEVLKKAIQSIADRCNWGIKEPSQLDITIDSGNSEFHQTCPPPLCIWRWEVQDRQLVKQDLPSDLADKVEARYHEREQVHSTALQLLKALPQQDRLALFSKAPKGRKPSAASEQKKKTTAIEIDGSDNDKEGSEKPKPKSKAKPKEPDPEKERIKAEKAAEKQKKEDAKAEREAEKKQKEQEKAAKAAERATKAAEAAEKKDAKDKAKAEKEAQKEAAKAEEEASKKKQKKQAGAFMGFFKAAAPAAEASTSSPARPSSSRDVSEEPKESDFDRAFKGFHCSKGVTFVTPEDYVKPPSKLSNEALFANDDSVSCKSVVQEITSKAKRGSIPAYRPRPKAPASVREIMENISEGDLVGNNNASSWRRSLRDRKKVPLKCLTFGATDRRPGYIGTFSKTSKLIRPRKPFAKDTCLFDYDYDSEDEWDEEEAGDGEDVNSDDARSQGSDEADSQDELDDWMCEDNEIEYEEGFEADGSEIQKDPTIAARDRAIAKKERSAKDSLARSKAPKALVPVSRGPVWEPQYGHQLHSAFESMSICFLNDAQPGLDPFTFVTKPAFANPPAPKPTANQTDSANSTTPDQSKPTEGVQVKYLPKRPFPKELYSTFIDVIQKSAASTKTELVLELSKKLNNGATKVAIEAELKEHVSKSKNAGQVCWTVSPGLHAKAAGDAMEVDS